MLAGCPNVTIVATSRERLRVAGEQLCPVPTLPAGDDESPAVVLFVERARAVAPGFEPDAVRAGGDRRDRASPRRAAAGDRAGRGAAAHARVERGGGRARPAVRAAAAGLSDLVPPRLVARGGVVVVRLARRRRCSECSSTLSVFAGPFTAADAAAVCGVGRGRRRHLAVQLVERSLVQRAPGRRYVLLETLRAFGAEQLTDCRRRRPTSGSATPAWMVEWVRGR